MQLDKNTNIILGIVAIIILALVFVYTRGGVDTSVTSGLQPETVGASVEISSFLRKISAIKDVRLNISVFDNPVLKNGLRDDAQELVPEDKGKPNPFAPISDLGASISPSSFSNNQEVSVPVVTQPKKVLSD